jgi:hypothetical protein
MSLQEIRGTHQVISAAYRHRRRGFGTVDPRDGGAIEGRIRRSTLRARRGLETHIASHDGPEASWVLDYPVKTFGLFRKPAFGLNRSQKCSPSLSFARVRRASVVEGLPRGLLMRLVLMGKPHVHHE